jgi:hypothetical protein
MHVHAGRSDAEANFWLYPTVTAASSFGYTGRELVQLIEVVEARRSEIRNARNEHFGQGP